MKFDKDSFRFVVSLDLTEFNLASDIIFENYLMYSNKLMEARIKCCSNEEIENLEKQKLKIKNLYDKFRDEEKNLIWKEEKKNEKCRRVCF